MKFVDVDKNLIDRVRGLHTTATMGGDPEFFVADGKGKIVASDKFFPGKDNPIIMESVLQRGRQNKLFFDGIQAEMAFAHNACREFVAYEIDCCLQEALRRIPPDYSIVARPSAKIPKGIIAEADPEARRFGCLPDFNAYTLTTNTPEMDATTHPFRYAGGHVHIGQSSPYLKKGQPEYGMVKTEDGHLETIRMLDLTLGLPSVLLDNSEDAKQRRSKYGKAGCFRPTPYGVEYRTLSCFWLKSPALVSLVYGLARLAWSILAHGLGEEFKKAVGLHEFDIKQAIDEGDDKSVKKMWTELRPYLALSGRAFSNPLHIGTFTMEGGGRIPDGYTGYNGAKPDVVMNSKGTDILETVGSLASFEYMVENGIETIIADDFKEEWNLDRTKGEVGDCSPDFRSHRGFTVQSFEKLKDNKDFFKFQKSLFKQIF
jgi:hypothetical protein